jgi:hypothetical protein
MAMVVAEVEITDEVEIVTEAEEIVVEVIVEVEREENEEIIEIEDNILNFFLLYTINTLLIWYNGLYIIPKP